MTPPLECIEEPEEEVVSGPSVAMLMRWRCPETMEDVTLWNRESQSERGESDLTRDENPQ